jgi:hypothetical protein
MACIMGNFLIALISFVWYTFIQPPPLSTPCMPDSTPAKPGPAPLNADQQQATTSPPAPVTPGTAGFYPRGAAASTAHHSHSDPDRAVSSGGSADPALKASPFEGHTGNKDVAASDGQGRSGLAALSAVPAASPAAGGEHGVPEGAEVGAKPGRLVATWRWLKTRPAWFKTAVLEEEDIKCVHKGAGS